MSIKPINNSILIEPLNGKKETDSGILLPESVKRSEDRAKVIAVGGGKIVDGSRVEMHVKVGDTIVYNQFSGSPTKDGDMELKLITIDDVMAIVS